MFSNGRFSDSFTVNFPTNNVDPGPRHGQLPDRSAAGQRAGRQSRAARRAYPAGHARPQRRHGALRQSGSQQRLFAHSTASATSGRSDRTSACQRRLHPLRAAQSVRAEGAEPAGAQLARSLRRNPAYAHQPARRHQSASGRRASSRSSTRATSTTTASRSPAPSATVERLDRHACRMRSRAARGNTATGQARSVGLAVPRRSQSRRRSRSDRRRSSAHSDARPSVRCAAHRRPQAERRLHARAAGRRSRCATPRSTTIGTGRRRTSTCPPGTYTYDDGSTSRLRRSSTTADATAAAAQTIQRLDLRAGYRIPPRRRRARSTRFSTCST